MFPPPQRKRSVKPRKLLYTRAGKNAYQISYNRTKLNNLSRRLSSVMDKGSLDTDIDHSISQTATLTLLNGISQGDGEGAREGKEITLQGVYIRGSLAGADTTNVSRVMIVIDKQCNGAAFGATDLLEAGGDPHALFNKQEVKRFIVLYDRTFATSGTGPNNTVFKKYIDLTRKGKKGGYKTIYNQNVSTVAGISTGSLYLFTVSDSGAATHPALTGNIRLKFVR